MVQLFEKASKIYPRRVAGRFRTLKWIAMAVLLTIYYGAPWLRYDRGPHVPGQAILIDLTGQRGYFFGIEIWPQEVYILVGILILAAIGLFFATALIGRAWCGFACPQTVWTDLFNLVEQWIQGDRNARMRLDEGPLTFEKVWKTTATHTVWLVIGLMTGGAWVFYFNDAPSLADDILHASVAWPVLGWILALTLSTYFMAGYARENVCKYMCPYARFQSAMFDKDTLIISYETPRGEPRAKHKQGTSWEGRGHCIDCSSCVVVCPMGIDIRDGLQFDCISCGLCIDACDTVMDKVMLPRGLIRYDTENNQLAREKAVAAGNVPPKGRMKWIRPRTLFYAGVMSVVGSLMLAALVLRGTAELDVIHNRSPLYVRLSDGDIRNNYQIKILNKTNFDKSYRLAVDGVGTKGVTVLAPGDTVVDALVVPANSVGEFRVELVSPAVAAAGRLPATFKISDDTGKVAQHASYFLRP